MAELTPDLILKHELLDQQHAEQFRCLQALADSLDGPRDAVEAAVATFADALVTHLAAEERLMDESLYPERTRHKSAHELFMADFLQMRQTLREEGPSEAVRDWITRRIPEWLRFHISVNDYPLGVYLARRQSRPAGQASQGGVRRS